jgi:hypothetical protein
MLTVLRVQDMDGQKTKHNNETKFFFYIISFSIDYPLKSYTYIKNIFIYLVLLFVVFSKLLYKSVVS